MLVCAAMFFAFAAPSFAAMDQIDEEEMAKAHASVTGKRSSADTDTDTLSKKTNSSLTDAGTGKNAGRNFADAANSPATAAGSERKSAELLYSLFSLNKGSMTVSLDNQEIDYSGSLERTLSGGNVLTGNGMGIFYTENVRATTTGSYTVNTRF